jgi:hypothetical protein
VVEKRDVNLSGDRSDSMSINIFNTRAPYFIEMIDIRLPSARSSRRRPSLDSVPEATFVPPRFRISRTCNRMNELKLTRILNDIEANPD